MAVFITVLAVGSRMGAQSLTYTKGQNIAPAYEGWEQDPDGSKWFVFGYMNRNWVEEIDIPPGPNNTIMPGGPDLGQPTHFLPRRNRFMFRVAVPKNFTEKDELIWTLTAHGVTEKAWATLRPDYILDNVVKASETGALGAGTSNPEVRSNQRAARQGRGREDADGEGRPAADPYRDCERRWDSQAARERESLGRVVWRPHRPPQARVAAAAPRPHRRPRRRHFRRRYSRCSAARPLRKNAPRRRRRLACRRRNCSSWSPHVAIPR